MSSIEEIYKDLAVVLEGCDSAISMLLHADQFLQKVTSKLHQIGSSQPEMQLALGHLSAVGDSLRESAQKIQSVKTISADYTSTL